MTTNRIRIIGAASGVGAQDRGCEDGPVAFHRSQAWHELERHPLIDWGRTLFAQDMPGHAPVERVADICHDLADEVAGMLAAGAFPLVIGGDHSVAAIIRAGAPLKSPSMNSDHHSILGVAPGASPAEVKRAYRRLAMRWHPDRNTDPAATEHFKRIRAAYEQLVAVDAPAGAKTAEDDPEPETEETVAKAADIRLNLEISLEEAAAGCRRSIDYTRGKACPTCDGSGEAGMTRTRFCEACHGSGRVHDAKRVLVSCEACVGRGFFSERICPDCGGSGREIASVSLEIRVPPGMLPGDELRLAGQGEAASDELAAGDLFLTIVIRSHPLFQLRGRDLHLSMPVSALALLAGGEIELPVLAGSLRSTLEPGDPTARDLRLPSKGFPGRGKYPAGDLVVHLQPVFPGKLNARQRKLLLQANAALLDEAAGSLPEIAAWNRQYLQR